MLYRIAKTATVSVVSAAVLLSCVNGYRDAFILHNPWGLGINVALVMFLAAGLVFIVRDRRGPRF